MNLGGVVHAQSYIQTLDRGRYCQVKEPRPETAAARYCRRTRSIAVRYGCESAPSQAVAQSAREGRGKSGQTNLNKPPSINDKALAAVDREWRTAREIFAILDEGAYRSTVAALVRLADAGTVVH